MLFDSAYRERWQKKLLWYQEQGYLSFEQGGGLKGILITSEDSKQGGIDSESLEQLITQLFFRFFR